jgi:hypothetical protein
MMATKGFAMMEIAKCKMISVGYLARLEWRGQRTDLSEDSQPPDLISAPCKLHLILPHAGTSIISQLTYARDCMPM